VRHEKEAAKGDQYLANHVIFQKEDVQHFSIQHVLL
jgi:hypothetical protein